MGLHNTLLSRRLQTLLAEVTSGDRFASADFWQEINMHGAPLVETIQGDDQHVLLTFLWRAEQPVRHVSIISSLVGYTSDKNQMYHLPHTDVWYKSYRVQKDIRTIYWLAPDSSMDGIPERPEDLQEFTLTWLPDPLNPHRFEIPANITDPEDTGGQMSVLELSDATEQPWILPRSDISPGRVAMHHISSRILGNNRRIWVYTPSGYSPDKLPYHFLVLFDGWRYLHAVPTTTILDNLIAAGAIPPTIAILIDNLDQHTRTRELTCSLSFGEFLTDELLPQIREQYNLSTNPTHAIVAGSSYGGLAATFVGLQHPEVFGNILSQSGTFWWKPDNELEYEWLTQQYVTTPKRHLRLYLEVGLLESRFADMPSPLEANRHLRDVLRAKGYDLQYVEYPGGHDYLSWRGSLANGLIMLTAQGTEFPLYKGSENDSPAGFMQQIGSI